MEHSKPNYQLRAARDDKLWTLEEAAEHVGVDVQTFWRWEMRGQMPRPYALRRLCSVFDKSVATLGFGEISEGDENARLLGASGNTVLAVPQTSAVSVMLPNRMQMSRWNGIRDGEEQRDWSSWFGLKLAQILRMISLWDEPLYCDGVQTIVDREIKMMDETLEEHQAIEQQALSRRQALITIAALPLTLLTWKPGPLGDATTQEFLSQCAASVTASWHLLRGNGLAAVSEIIAQFAPSLQTLALRPSKYQRTAARLAAQVGILQGVLAMHRLNFVAREGHCKDAVRYAGVSGDNNLRAAALTYLGYTYSFCYIPRLPEKGIQTFLEALQAVGEDAPLLRSNICMGLAEAYAQCKEEQPALRYIGLAQERFPTHPELDPSFVFGDCSLHVLYQWQGKMYLELSEHYSERGFQQKAGEALLQGIGVQSISERSTAETMIYRADAARILGDLETYTTCLSGAAQMAVDLGSRKRYSEAQSVYQKTPEKWLRERRIQVLAEEVFGQLPGRN